MSDLNFGKFRDDESPLGRLMSFCEIHCVSLCCGPNAYETAPEHVMAWVRSVEPTMSEAARRQLEAVLRDLHSAPDQFFFLDTEHDKAEVVEFFSELASGLEAAKTAG